MSMNFSSSENATISSKTRVDVALRQAEDRRVHVDVLAAGQLGVEAGAELEQRGEPAAGDDLALVGLQDPGDALQQRRLARAVVAEDADGRALLDVDVDVVERDEVLERDAPEVDHLLLQRRVVLVVEPEVLRDVPDLDRGGHGYSSSAKFASLRPNTADRDREHDDADDERVRRGTPRYVLMRQCGRIWWPGLARPGSSGCRAWRRSRAGRSARSA